MVHRESLRGHAQAINALAFSADGRFLATGSMDGKVCLWDPWTGNLLARWDARCGSVSTLAFSPDGQTLVVGGFKGLSCFAMHTWRGVRQLVSPCANLQVAFHPRQPWLVTAHGNAPLSVWDLRSLEFLRPLPGFVGHFSLMSFSPEGDQLAANRIGFNIWDWETGKVEGKGNDNARALAFHPDGQYLAWGASNKVTLWDRTRKAELWTRDGGRPVDNVAFCPATSQVVAISGRPCQVVFLDLQTAQEVRRAVLPADISLPDIVVAPAGRRLAQQTTPHQTVLYGFPNLAQLAVVETPAEDGPVTALALSARGRYLAIRGKNKVTVWETQTRQPLLSLAVQDQRLKQMVFSPDERYLAIVDGNVRLLLYDLPAFHAELKALGIQ
jgi:WD40 repeat protein